MKMSNKIFTILVIALAIVITIIFCMMVNDIRSNNFDPILEHSEIPDHVTDTVYVQQQDTIYLN